MAPLLSKGTFVRRTRNLSKPLVNIGHDVSIWGHVCTLMTLWSHEAKAKRENKISREVRRPIKYVKDARTNLNRKRNEEDAS